MLHADVLVFATPIYYYEMCGQMKTLLDRANPLYPSDYAFRDVYFIATAAEDGDEVWTRASSGLGAGLPASRKHTFLALSSAAMQPIPAPFRAVWL